MPESVEQLPLWRAVAVVIAHPDDESFGLGAVIDAFVRAGSSVSVLCFTQGEASTLGADAADLATVRAGELADAARALGVVDVELLAFADGGLDQVPDTDLVACIAGTVRSIDLTDSSCSTRRGSPGIRTIRPRQRLPFMRHETQGLPVLAWSLPAGVADELSEETGVRFLGRAEAELDLRIVVSRERQREAVSCHPSQAVPGSALWRRLELQGDSEHLMWLR